MQSLQCNDDTVAKKRSRTSEVQSQVQTPKCRVAVKTKKYLQKKAVEEYEVIYQNNALVKAILHQDLSSTAITIHKYEYTFRP